MRPALVLFLLSIAPFLLAGQGAPLPRIQQLLPAGTTVEQYGKFEVSIDLQATYTNPYDYDQVAVRGVFTAPDGAQRQVDGFYMTDYRLDASSGLLQPGSGPGRFRLRFAPDRPGEWQYQVIVTDANGSSHPVAGSFHCTGISSASNRGFVRANQTNYLQFDNGEPYIAIGENMGWQQHNAYLDYRQWLTALQAAGGNFIRLWHADWGLGLEWKAGSNGFAGLRRYKETNAAYQDWLFDFCAERGIYIMLCLQHHGQVSTQVNPAWRDNPYNAANGGPARNTWDFFADTTARAHTRNRLRYIVARWGYARSIMAWELFNEVEWTDQYASHAGTIADWHREMAAFLKQIDPQQHLVTTSFAHDNYGSDIWGNPDIDLTQTHFYINTSNIERALVGGQRSYLEQYGKPTLVGEFGLGGSSSLANTDPSGVHVHNSLWAGLFGGGLGTAMSWWWDNYIHPRNLYYHFRGIASVAANIPFLAENMTPAPALVSGAPGDLFLTPALGWGVRGDERISIDSSGRTVPANPALSSFLYGSLYNTQHRSPPTFSVNYPRPGAFAVTTANAMSSAAPRITIYVDDKLVLDEAARPEHTYTVNIPTGDHRIRVDNAGTDWAGIAAYRFEGIGSQVDAYVLRGENRDIAAGWLLNHQYNHQRLREQGPPPPVPGSRLQLDGFADGSYAIFWYDCLTGELLESAAATAESDRLTVAVPPLSWDLAFLISSDPVATVAQTPALDFSVYPSPARAGQTLRFEAAHSLLTTGELTLFDATGRPVLQHTVSAGSLGQVDLPPTLPAGTYWLQWRSGAARGTHMLMVTP